MNVIFTKTFAVSDRQKEIKIVNDDLENIEGEYDILVCSAYKNDYIPTKRSVIGKLHQMGIRVKKLAKEPELDCRNYGVWIAKTEHERFKRICCVELLEYSQRFEKDLAVDTVLKSTFSTLKYAVEQASIMGLPVKKIILPILGAGQQRIELSYIIPPLVNQVKAILNLYDVEEITFFEVDENRANLLKKYLFEALNSNKGTDVFISYSSKQSESAYEIAELLRQNGISFWMAPESIPPSADYLDEIPSALTNTKILLLLLTPESETSAWVSKEVATAIGSNKRVIPCQIFDYELSPKYTFALQDCQILKCFLKKDYKAELVELIKRFK